MTLKMKNKRKAGVIENCSCKRKTQNSLTIHLFKPRLSKEEESERERSNILAVEELKKEASFSFLSRPLLFLFLVKERKNGSFG